ncbi:MAG TPA: PQQ-binding-like beta-propeller repeat protein [Planctomycetota bacterium]|nr:PQQ-binding-like beta-propeller repeat protein [Planctomycetota bacterium]
MRVMLTVAVVLAAAASASGEVVGWRGDGTGRFPDAKPVTEWGRWPVSPNRDLRRQIKRPAPNDTGQNAAPVRSGQILEWLVIGPFTPKDPAAALDEELLPNEADLRPDEGEKAGELEWKRHVSVNKDAGVAMDWIQLAGVVGRKGGKVAYAHNYLYSQVKGTVVFHMDQGGGCRIWVNGKVVHDNPKPVVTMYNINYVCYAANEHWAGELPVLGRSGSQKIRVDLEKGWNRVLIKSTGNLNLRLVELPETGYETKNVVWTCPLPSYSNAQPIIVGDRIFVMSESEDLVCVDKHTGRILWKRSTFYTDCLSDQEKQANPLLKAAAELTEKLRGETNVDQRIRLRNQIKQTLAKADERAWKEHPQYKDILPLQEKLKDKTTPDAERQELMRKIRSFLEKMEGPKESNPFHSIIKPLEELAAAPDTKEVDRAAIRRKIEEVLTHAAPVPRFLTPLHSHIQATGFTTPTPVSDGKYVTIYLGWGIAACYDLDGNRQWASLATDLGGVGAFNNNSPVLVDDKVVILRNVQMRAYDARTGRVAWTTPDLRAKIGVDIWHGFGTGGNYSASLCAFKLGGTDVVYLNSAIVRASDGKVFCPAYENFGSNPRGTPVPTNDAVYYASCTAVFRFPLPDGAPTEGMRLERRSRENYEGGVDTYSSILVHDGLLYALRSMGKLWVYDAETLGVVYTQQLDMDPYSDYDHPGVTPSLSLAGSHIFAFDNQGNGVVFEPGREFKPVATNRIATCVERKWVLDPDEIFQSAPVFEGDRFYLRGETYLYCIGK